MYELETIEETTEFEIYQAAEMLNASVAFDDPAFDLDVELEF